MIVPRMKLDGATTLDSHRRSAPIDGQIGSYSPRPRGSEANTDADGVLPSHHGPSVAIIPADSGNVRRSTSMPLAGIVGGADVGDLEECTTHSLEFWSMRGEVLRQQSLGANATVPFRFQIGDFRVNGRQVADPRQSHRTAAPITSLTVSQNGSHIAYGDHSGKLFVLGALPPTEAAKRAGDVGGAFAVQGDTTRSTVNPQAVQDNVRHRRYKALCGATAYSAVIDPLNSTAVTPAITSLAFLPQDGPSNFLVTANEKVPKLFKITNNYDSPQATFRAVDLMGSKMIGPLVSTSRTHTHIVKQVHRYGMDHEYTINSVNPTIDGSYFYTADETCVRLWSVDHADTSIEVVAMPKANGEEGEESMREAIISTKIFPQEPSLCFLATSAGNVRVCDSRESLRWTNRFSHQVFSNPLRDVYDGKYSSVTNAITGGCALSQCGRYIAARDFFSVIMWDVRKAGPVADLDQSIVRRWELHPRLRHHIDSLYQSNLLFERFGIDFATSISNANTGCIVTGGLGNTIFALDPLSTADAAQEPIPGDVDSVVRAAEASMRGMRAFVLPEPAAIASEQALLVQSDDSKEQSDPFCHRLPAAPVKFLSNEQLQSDRDMESGRVAHVVDTKADGGGLWASVGEFLLQLTV